jgi:tetratricopeptide (TPR) repeat protein
VAIGSLVSRRFYLESQAGVGGMGTVFRALDNQDGRVVALKILRGREDVDVERFRREVAILAELDHPNIVRYATHGLTETGEHSLAMEWLDGEDLAERLARKALSDAEALTVVSLAAAAIGHAHGAVHRDLKPSNLFLRDHDVSRVAVLDFGIAGFVGDPHKLTRTGVILGTPGYMAPEHVGGSSTYDPRSDIFSMGCVLFECLAGRPVFQGQTPMAVLAKLMLGESPRLADLRPGIAPALDALVSRMLAKDPDQRPQHLTEVVAELDAIAEEGLARRSASPLTLSSTVPLLDASERGAALTRDELRLVTLVLAGRPAAEGVAPVVAPTLAAELAVAIEPHGGRLTPLADGSLIVTVWAPGTAVDRAERAARCALALQARFPELSVVMVTGRGQVAARVLEGDTIDRGARALAGTPAGTVRVDDATAGMIAAQFHTDREGGGTTLRAEILAGASPPRAPEPPGPFVGRSRELAMLEGMFVGTVSDPMASAVLITGPAGTGKSRLCLELFTKLRRDEEPLEILCGRADALVGGAALGAVADLVRSAAGIRSAEPVDVCQQKLRARLGRHLTGQMLNRVVYFLGEMVGLPGPEGTDAVLVAARANPMLMGDAMRASWEEWLIAECRAQPVILVLEDLQWGDGATVRLIDSTLRNLRDLPLLVIAVARAESPDEALVGWVSRDTPTVRLGPLPARASEKLVRELLGGAATQAVADRLIEQSGGNPFYLRELIRAVADGRGDVLPDSVLGLVEARLDAEGPDAKRVLRAASVFGDRFGVAGVAALLGGDRRAVSAVRRALTALSSHALVVPVGDEGPGSSEFVFSDALVREAAYAMLTESDRMIGHRLAGEWLEQTSHPDAMAMAEHFRRGAEPGRAARWCRRAAEKALEASDLPAAIGCADEGAALGAGGEDLGALRLVQTEAHFWLGDLEASAARGAEAASLLPVGSAPWFRAVVHLVSAGAKLGGGDRAETWVEAALRAEPAPGARTAQLTCLAECARQLLVAGRAAAADAVVAVIGAAVLAEPDALDVLAAAGLARLGSLRTSYAGDLGAAVEQLQVALDGFESVGDQRNAVWLRSSLGFVLTELGDFAAAEDALRAARAQAVRLGLDHLTAAVLHNLGLVLSCRGALAEAEEVERSAVDAFERLRDPRMEGQARSYLARIAILSGDFTAAEREADRAYALFEVAPPLRAGAAATRARALLGLGRDAEALTVARTAVAALASPGALAPNESMVRLVFAEALARAGAEDELRESLATARERLLERAAKISDPAARALFLTAVPDNARTMELSGGRD